jgi:hypothetical protein
MALHWGSSQRYNDGRERCSSQRCCGVGRQRTTACNVLPALLQQRTRRRNVTAMASNTLDLAALLRWPIALQLRPAFFFIFYFLPDNLKKEKEWVKERSLTPAL